LEGRTSVNTSIINISIASSTGPNVAALHGVDNNKVGEELQCIDLPVNPLSPYSFVRRVHDLVGKMGD
jgi:hypothetical protein